MIHNRRETPSGHVTESRLLSYSEVEGEACVNRISRPSKHPHAEYGVAGLDMTKKKEASNTRIPPSITLEGS